MLWKILLVMCLCASHSSATENDNGESDIPIELSDSHESLSFSEEELHNLQMMFRFVSNIDQATVGPVLEGAQIPVSLIQQFQSLDAKEFVKSMMASDLNERSQEEKLGRYKRTTTNQEGGYPGCEEDYGAFVLPITNKLYNLGLQICVNMSLNPLCKHLSPQPTPPMPSWGLTMLDAMGKIPAGLSEGNLYWVGSYLQCKGINVVYNASSGTRAFDGQYCRITMETLQPALGNVSLGLQLGVCVPNTCSAENVTSFIDGNIVLNALMTLGLKMKIANVFCGFTGKLKDDAGALTLLIILVLFLLVTLLATLYEALLRRRLLSRYIKSLGEKDSQAFDNLAYDAHKVQSLSDPQVKKSPLKINVVASDNTSTKCTLESLKPDLLKRFEMAFVGFSAYSNTGRIWRMTNKEGHFPMLNGIRALSYGWVIMGHTWLYGPLASVTWVTDNVITALKTYPHEWSFQPILNFQYAGDTFLVLSGFLVTYWWLRVHAKYGKVTWWMPVHYFLHKYWRLAPSLMLTMAVYGLFYTYLGRGPLYPSDIPDADFCRNGEIWKNALMVTNLVSTDSMCGAWTWWVAMLFQLHIAAFVVLLPLVLKPVLGYILMAAMYIAYIGATAGISDDLHTVGGVQGAKQWAQNYLIVPWCRAGPYVIGMALASLFNEISQRKWKTKLHPALVAGGWVLALAMITTPVYVTYDFMRPGGTRWTTPQWVAYDTLAPTSWALGVAWIIFACHYGYGGFIKEFLSQPIWTPLSRIGYVAYLFNVMIIMNTVFTQNICIYISGQEQLRRWMLYIMSTYFIGFVFTCLWQYPLSVGIERAILCRNQWDWLRSGIYPTDVIDSDGKDEIESPVGKAVPYKAQQAEEDQTSYEKLSLPNDGLRCRQNGNVETAAVAEENIEYGQDDTMSTPL